LIAKKSIGVASYNMGFCNIGAEAIHMSSGSLLGFGSGRSFSIWLFVLIFIFSISNGQRFRAEDFQIPQHRKALSLAVILWNAVVTMIFLNIYYE
jgi:hypothetical protein